MIFENLNVSQDLVTGLNEIGVKEPTNIQEKVIPLVKEGRDVIGISKTGSGKTIAFGVPILENIEHGKGIQFLIIAPVRELAVQISRELKRFGKHIEFSVATVYGGVAINPQIEAIKRADIIVTTPGRILDHIENYGLDLSTVKGVVLDEADKMVEMGFIEDIRRILDQTQKNRQIMLFGATISNEIEHLKKQYMHDPLTVQVESHVKEEYLEQYYYNVKHNEKFSLLVHLLKKEEKGLTIIFCSARSIVELVTKNLRANGIKAEMIHGKLSQNRRLRVIEDFHKGKYDILVASAVAARGLDIKDVTHIFNYDLSQDPQEYIHRVGRTARAGQSGKALTLLSERDHDTFREILSRYPVNVKELPLEDFQMLRFDSSSMRRRGNGFSRGRGQGSYRGRSSSSRSYGGRSGSSYGRSGSSSGGRYGSSSSSSRPHGYSSSGSSSGGRFSSSDNRPRSYGGRSSSSGSSSGGRFSSSGARSHSSNSSERPKFPRRRY